MLGSGLLVHGLAVPFHRRMLFLLLACAPPPHATYLQAAVVRQAVRGLLAAELAAALAAGADHEPADAPGACAATARQGGLMLVQLLLEPGNLRCGWA